MTPQEIQCAELVRRADPDRFMSIMAVSPKLRADLFVIYAFTLEVARAPWVTKEALIAEMRLQWWLDVIEEVFDGAEVRKHEVSTPLASLIKKHDLPRELFDNLIQARRWDIYSDPHKDEIALRDYITHTSSHLALAGLIADKDASRTDLKKISYGAGLAAYLQAIPALSNAQKIPLIDGRSDAVKELCNVAHLELSQGLNALPRTARKPIAKLVWLAKPSLKKIAKTPLILSEDGVRFAPIEKKLRLIFA